MSKRETPLVRRYWEMVGGTLVEEFLAVSPSLTCGARLMDGIILPNQPLRLARRREVSLRGEDVIVVQAKVGRLGMSLLGQAVFSAELIKEFAPASVRSVALCTQDDAVLQQLLAPYPHLEVVVLGEFHRPRRAGAAPGTPAEIEEDLADDS